MWVFCKKIRKIVLFLTLMAVGTVQAEVKLRIYLQDGSLQAGNLVSETKDMFVILTKEGRIEVPKNRIMFVNGKTLKQWGDRPDKLFQTEIIPSEVPNPAFVHGQATDPIVEPVAELKPVVPVEKKEEAKPKEKEIVKAKETPLIAKPEPTPLAKEQPKEEKPKPVEAKPPKEEKVAAKPAPTEEKKPEQEKPKKTEVVAKEASPESAQVAQNISEKEVPKPNRKKKSKRERLVEETKAVSSVEPVSRRPSGTFDRRVMAAQHFDRAVVLMEEGKKGQALQELHIATLLDRQKDQTVLLLGKLYKEQGLLDRADKYFSHPLLKKKEEIKALSQEIQVVQKADKKKRYILYASAGTGLFMTLPLLALVRRMKRSVKGPRVITAETAETMLQQAEAEKVEAKSQQSVDDLLSEVLASRSKSLERVPPVEEKKPPLAPPPFEKKPSEPIKPPVRPMPEQSPKPGIGFPSTPVEPVKPPFKQDLPPTPVPAPVYASQPPTPAPLPEPVPELEKVAPVLPARIQEVLAGAQQAEEALQRGNSYATEEQFDKARREYRTVLALSPAKVEAHLGLGFVSFLQGQMDLAFEHYLRALQIDPQSADAHYGIGRVLLETNRIEEAIAEFQATLQLDPTFDDARETLTSLGKAA